MDSSLEYDYKTSTRIYVGCGEDRREGFLHSDIRDLPGIDYVCKAWELSEHVQGVTEIYSRHMLEHLTADEAMVTLQDWYTCLGRGGSVYIVVPNMDYHIKQWQDAVWSDEELANSRSNASHALGGLWGWQRQCDPKKPDYEQSYWDVHKTGYNSERLRYVLKKAGFSDITTNVKNNAHLVGFAVKI